MTEPMFETHTPVDAEPSAIAAALADYRPEPQADVDKLRHQLYMARRDREYFKRKSKRLNAKLNRIEEVIHGTPLENK